MSLLPRMLAEDAGSAWCSEKWRLGWGPSLERLALTCKPSIPAPSCWASVMQQARPWVVVGGGTRASPGPTSHGEGRLARNKQWRETEFPRGHPSSRVKITFCYTSNTSVEQNRPLLLPLAHLLYGNHSRVVASECPVP